LKVKLNLEEPGVRELRTLDVVEMGAVPRMGELIFSSRNTLEVIQVIHTPFSTEQDAIVVVRIRG
jgi:hypothetical protein